MRKLKTATFAADRLAQMVATGSLAMPDFQRDFVWEPWRVVDFLESIANDWPTGALLFLQAPPNGVPSPFRAKGFKNGPSIEGGRPTYYVLDGQQRLTAIFHAYYNASPDAIYYADGGADATTDIIRAVARRRSKRILAREDVVLISELVGVSHSDLQTGFPFATRQRTLDALARELPGLRRGEYHFAVTVLPWDVELAALAKIFETVNLAGVRLNAFDLMVAVLYPQGFDLREAWQSVLTEDESLQTFDIDGLQVLRLIALWNRASPPDPRHRTGAKGIRQSDILRVPARFVQRYWAKAVTAFSSALDFARTRLGVVHPEFVPSDSMLLTIAALLSKNAEVEAWFWRSCVSQAHGQGANTQVLADFDSSGAPGESDESVEIDLLSLLQQPLARNAIAARGLCCALALNGALDPLLGTPFSEEPNVEVQLKSLTELVGDEPLPATVGDVVMIRKGTISKLKEALSRGDRGVWQHLRSQGLHETTPQLSGAALQISAHKQRLRIYSKVIGRVL